MNKRVLRTILTLILLLSALLKASPAQAEVSASGQATALQQTSACPSVPTSSKYMIVWGNVTLQGAPAPVGTLIKARSVRGNVVMCAQVTTPGILPAVYVIGEDTSVTPTINGMRTNESLQFLVNNVVAGTSPTVNWVNSKEPLQINLDASGSPIPTAAFSTNKFADYAPFTVQFTDTSTSGVSAWLWSFGDGSPDSTLQNPSHTYTEPGVYTVRLKVTGPTGWDWITQDNVIEGWVPPTASFAFDKTSGNAPLTVNFTNTSIGYFTSSFWTFGDGNTSTEKNPSHTYALNGTYTVTLTVSGIGMSDSDTQPDCITVTIDPATIATPNFTYDPVSGAAPLAVSFTNTSTGIITSQSWNFGDGATSTEASPQHTYQNSGTYTAELTVSGPFGSGAKQATVTVLDPVTAGFSAAPTLGSAPLQVAFTNTTQAYRPITGYLWDFGDGQTSTDANPVHTYTATGTYTVTLTASIEGAQDAEVKSNFITVSLPQPIFSDGFESDDLSQWTASLTDSGDLSVTQAAALTGSYGLQAMIDDNAGIYLTDDSPAAEKRYRARFYFDPNSISMANNNSHYLLLGYQGSTSYILILDLRFTTTYGYQLRAFTVLDNATTATTAWYTIADQPNFIEFDWLAASAPDSNNGSLTLWLNGVQKASLSGLDNDTRQLDRVRLGAVLGIDTETRGTYYFDDFESGRNYYIGFEPNQADFSASPLQGKAPLTVNFNNLTQPVDAGNSYLWDFGDGATSTDPNPSHTYTTYGEHTVSLTVSGPRGTDVETKNSYIQLPELIFADGFESGDLSLWSASLTDNGDMSVTDAAALAASKGMQILIDDNTNIYLTDDSPDAEKRYRARFYFDPNSISMASANSHYLLLGYQGATPYILLLEFRFMTGYGYQVRTFTVLDSGSTISSNWSTISDQAHYLELDWQAASAAGQNDGALTFWIDGVQQASLTGLDNDTRQIDRVRLGAVLGIDSGTRGTYYFDAFQSGRANLIGREDLLANFSASPLQGKPGQLVNFTNQTQPLDPSNTYLWDFGDGATSTEVNPSHTYSGYSTYTVSLTASGPRGVDSEVKTGYIQTLEEIFKDGFELGDLSRWTTNVNDSGDLSVTSAAALVGAKGLHAVIDDNTSIYVTDDSPNAEKRYRARFYFDPNSISMASGNNHYLLLGYQGISPYILIQDFRYMAGTGYQLKLSTVLDSGAAVTTSWFTISDQPHFIEFDWRAATAAGANNGTLTYWIDGVQKASLTGLDNDTRQIDRVRLGAVMALDTETRGTYYFDAFQSGSENYIGTELTLADFSASQLTGKAPLTVNFTNLTQPVDPGNSYLWDFGDDNTSTEVNPSHIYSSYGIYTVSLTATGPRGESTTTKSSYIVVTEAIFADGFESGDLSKWSSNVADGGDLNVTASAAMLGSLGLQAVIDDNTSIYVVDNSPNAEKRYRARFYFDPNSIAMASGNNHYLLLGYMGTSPYILIQDFRYLVGSGYQLKLSTVLDTGTVVTTGWFTISDQAHFIEFDWQAATAAGANNGSLTYWIDGVQKANLTGLDNDTRVIDQVRLGAVLGIDTETRGAYYIDGFQSVRESYIGE